MNLPTRHMLLGMGLGAVCATVLGAMGPGMVIDAFAQEPRTAFDPATLVRFGEREFQVHYDAGVDTEPLETIRVKKIEAGRVSWVDVAVTSTGTYSTDALASAHIQYPGIHVSPVRPPETDNRFSFWDGQSWTSFSPARGTSMVFAGSGTALRLAEGNSCVYGQNYRVC